MNLLSAENIAKSFDDKWLFRDITIGVSQGEKLALVGVNGAGKSTLLKILTGQVTPDNGKIAVRDGIRIGILAQQPDVAAETRVKDVLFDADNEVAAAVQEYESCLHDPDVDGERMQAALERMEAMKAWDFDARVHEITSRLDVPDLEQTFGNLSGGQRRRIFLAKLLLASPDLMFLDEPTNHLDLEAIEWLENYLSSPTVSLIMVTHDRYFLDNVAQEIVELDRGKLYRYKGNYAYFLEKKSEREEMLRTEVAKARNLMKRELEWMRKQPKARGTKAKYRIDAFEAIKEKASQEIRKERMELDIRESRQGGKILEVTGISKSWEGKKAVDNFSYIFKKFDRIGIVGKNGVGKSTFLNLLTGRIKPDTGEVIPGVTTKFGYFTQDSLNLNPTNRIIEEVRNIAEFITLSDGSQVSASKFLDNFLFPPEKQYAIVEKLSGGEKKRLQLLKMLVAGPNFLVLDEPTNDFDIDSLNVLEEFLEQFNGCLLLVSHDRYFMDHLVDQLFVFEGDGIIRHVNGNYTDYREMRDELQAQPAEEKVTVIKEPVASVNAPPGKVPQKVRIEHAQLEKEMAELESAKGKLVERLGSAQGSHDELLTWSQEIGRLEAELERRMARWMELEEQIGGK